MAETGRKSVENCIQNFTDTEASKTVNLDSKIKTEHHSQTVETQTIVNGTVTNGEENKENEENTEVGFPFIDIGWYH